MLFFYENLHNDFFLKKSAKVGNFRNPMTIYGPVHPPPPLETSDLLKPIQFRQYILKKHPHFYPPNNQNLKINFNGVKKLL